jgi:hypothetical protein
VIKYVSHKVVGFYLSDLNNDGYADFIIYDNANTIQFPWPQSHHSTEIFYSNNSNNYNSSVLISNTEEYYDLVVTDFDNDNDLDFLIKQGLFTTNVNLLENSGSNNFNYQILPNNTVQLANQVSIIDFDFDGDQDIISISDDASSNGLNFTENINGTFSIPTYIDTIPNSRLLATDIDNDSVMEIIAWDYYNNDSTFYIYKENGANYNSSIFLADTNNQSSRKLYSFSANDINNDGKKDIIYQTIYNSSDCFTHQESYIKIAIQPSLLAFDNSKSITSIKAINVSSLIYNTQSLGVIETADLNNDSLLDIVSVSNSFSPNNSKSIITYQLNLGEEVFSEQIEIIKNNFEITNMQLKDIDNDMDYDIVYSPTYDSLGSVYFIKNLGGTNFAAPQIIIDTVLELNNFILVDIDSDLDLDLVINNYKDSSISIFTNFNNNFSLSQFLYTNTNGFRVNLKSFDSDNDNDMDLLVGDGYTPLKLYINNGSGNYVFSKNISSKVSACNTGDIDNDGDLDIILSYVDSIYYHSYGFILNNGNNNFSGYNYLGSGIKYGINTTDINNDNYIDFAIDDGYFINNTTNGFVFYPYKTPIGGRYNDDYNCYNFSDLDNDGDKDLILGRTCPNSYFWMKNNFIPYNTSIEETNNKASNAFVLYPNPTNGDITLNFNGQINTGIITIYNVNGQEVLNTQIKQSKSLILNASELTNGVYFIRVQNKNEVVTQKFIKQ